MKKSNLIKTMVTGMMVTTLMIGCAQPTMNFDDSAIRESEAIAEEANKINYNKSCVANKIFTDGKSSDFSFNEKVSEVKIDTANNESCTKAISELTSKTCKIDGIIYDYTCTGENITFSIHQEENTSKEIKPLEKSETTLTLGSVLSWEYAWKIISDSPLDELPISVINKDKSITKINYSKQDNKSYFVNEDEFILLNNNNNKGESVTNVEKVTIAQGKKRICDNTPDEKHKNYISEIWYRITTDSNVYLTNNFEFEFNSDRNQYILPKSFINITKDNVKLSSNFTNRDLTTSTKDFLNKLFTNKNK